jgi:HD-GYP domain-containing protein (c-di-GMP phosphodiesterase class II)
MQAPCAHAGGHSAVGRYLAAAGELQFVLVCDACGAERGDVDSVAYRPRPRPYANHPAELLARALGLDAHVAGRVRLAALLCDIGAARIPAGVLDQPGPLSDADWEAVRRHPEHSAAMLAGPGYADVRPWILAHHERPDGRGYPSGVPGALIPLEASVISVATAWEGMTSDRPHRRALNSVTACRELVYAAGEQFDPTVVDAALGVLAPAVAARAAA